MTSKEYDKNSEEHSKLFDRIEDLRVLIAGLPGEIMKSSRETFAIKDTEKEVKINTEFRWKTIGALVVLGGLFGTNVVFLYSIWEKI